MTKPTICRDVVYRARILNHDGHLVEQCDRPAKVSFAYEDGSVDLTWSGRGAHEHAAHNEEKVPHDPTGKEIGTWRWPPGSPTAMESKPEEKK